MRETRLVFRGIRRHLSNRDLWMSARIALGRVFSIKPRIFTNILKLLHDFLVDAVCNKFTNSVTTIPKYFTLRFHDIFIDKQTTNYSWIGEQEEGIPSIYVIWSFYLKGWQTQSKIEKHLILFVSFHLQFPLPRTKTAFLHAGARDASRKC